MSERSTDERAGTTEARAREQWFDGRTAIVTGASRGIGRACALALAERGARVVAADVAACTGLLEAAEALPGDVRAVEADVREPVDLEEVVDVAGAVDVLVNNAGVVARVPIDELTPERWRTVVETNLTGAYNAVRAAKRPLCEGGGSIVTVSSMLSHVSYPNRIAYSSSKGGLDAMTRALAAELGPEGVRANAVNPGFIRTDMTREHLDRGAEATFREKTAIGRLGEPRDVAETVAFLASDRAAFISGETVLIDGGQAALG